MQSYYEINVSRHGTHLFATAPRSLLGLDQAREMFKLLRRKFPESEGYKVTGTYWKSEGKRLFEEGV